MSRCYLMMVKVTEFESERKDALIDVIEDGYWDVDWRYDADDFLYAQMHVDIGGGISEDEYADLWATDLWKANGGYCSVRLQLLWLDEPTHVRDMEDFERLSAQREGAAQ